MPRQNNFFLYVVATQKGGALVMALVASVILGIATLVAQQQAAGTESNLRHLRIRALLSLKENLSTSLLNQSRSYQCVGGNNASFPDCNIEANVTFLKKEIEFDVPGCKPRPAAKSEDKCGIVIENNLVLYNAQNHSVKLTLIYNGVDVAIRNLDATVEMKLNFLATSGSKISCSAARPFLQRIESQGKFLCGQISSIRICPDGYFLKNLDVDSNFKANCEKLASGPVGCGFDSYVESYNWAGGTKFQPKCENFLDPYTAWPNE